MPPPVKPWGKIDKKLLQKLIDRGKIDITRVGDTEYIDRIRHKYFRPRDLSTFDATSEITLDRVISRTAWAVIVESNEEVIFYWFCWLFFISFNFSR